VLRIHFELRMTRPSGVERPAGICQMGGIVGAVRKPDAARSAWRGRDAFVEFVPARDHLRLQIATLSLN
jgi:hypothetical protein